MFKDYYRKPFKSEDKMFEIQDSKDFKFKRLIKINEFEEKMRNINLLEQRNKIDKLIEKLYSSRFKTLSKK